VPRNYRLPVIKQLFFEAVGCAYPGCTEPLVFDDRGVATVVAEIAHIRSEKLGGPRYDPDYVGDIDGVENLLVLCPKHHKPVDRHESKYSIGELLEWKEAQRAAAAGGGIAITDDEARAYLRLSQEERTALAEVARCSERLIVRAESAAAELAHVQRGRQRDRDEVAAQMAAREVDEQGRRTPIGGDRVTLPKAEEDAWSERAEEAARRHRPLVLEALGQLREELAVVRMMSSTGMTTRAQQVAVVAEGVVQHVGDERTLETSVQALRTAVARLWQAANGEDEDADRS